MKRDLSLEGLRGVAALVVLLSHIVSSFYPVAYLSYSPENFGQPSLRGNALFAFFNGDSAVALFFVLSGFVLSKGYFARRDRTILLRSAIKRWPRLAGPVLVACLFSWMLWATGLYRYNEAAAITGSPWLQNHLFNGVDQSQMSILDAAIQGLTTFVTGKAYYDPPIWTMAPEFIGSYIVFAVAVGIGALGFGTFRSAGLIVASIVATLLLQRNLALFPIGLALGYFGCPQFSGRTVPVVAALGIYLLGFSGDSIGAYSLFPTHSWTVFLTQTLGAIALIVAAQSLHIPHTGPSHQFCRFLGWLSFPLYLLHVPILCSFGSSVLIGTGSPLLASVATVAMSLLASCVLGLFNTGWLSVVDRMADRLVVEKQVVHP